MKNKNKTKEENSTILRDENPLIVEHACSLEDEVRFYITNTLYVSAKEVKEEGELKGIDVGLSREEQYVKTKKEKSKKRDYLISIALCVSLFFIIAGIMAVSLLIGSYFDNISVYLIVVNLFLFLLELVSAIVIEAKTTSPSLKSKHSAEHMMVNFLTTHKRLPKSINEVKTSSRFANKCGSRRLVESKTEDFASRIIAAIITGIVEAIYVTFFTNLIIMMVVLLAVYLGVYFLIRFLLKKVEWVYNLLNPLKKLLTNLAQCANTTKKVKDDDITLVYFAARTWISIVYPEYYNPKDDIVLNIDNA